MRVLVLSLLLTAVPASATDVYRWVDASGQPHYSDQWQPGAEKIRITTDSSAPGARPGEQPAGAVKTRESNPTEAAGRRYESLEIVRPVQEEVLWNIEGQLPVSVRVNPALQSGDGLRLYLDGKQQELPAGSTETQLQGVFRGAHTLRAEVTDQSGAVLMASSTVSFMVRQTSLLNPARPAVP